MRFCKNVERCEGKLQDGNLSGFCRDCMKDALNRIAFAADMHRLTGIAGIAPINQANVRYTD